MANPSHATSPRWERALLRAARIIVLSTVTVFFPACGSKGGDDNAPGSSPPPVLNGDPAQAAAAALQDIDAGPVAPSDVVQGHLLTRLLVALNGDATVGQVNSAAQTVGATAIAFSTPSSLLLTLKIPRQASIGDLHRLADLLQTQPGIFLAVPAREFETSVLPELIPGQPVSSQDLSHLLPTRFPPAWNARGAADSDCLPRSVPVYIWDKFGDSGSRPAFFNQIDFNGFVFDDVGGAGDVSGHGFDIAMTLGANFNAQKPTGANPFQDCLMIHEIEAFGRDLHSAISRAAQAVRRETGNRFILNVSMNFPDPLCGPNSDQRCDAQTILSTPVSRLGKEIVLRVLHADFWAEGHTRGNLGQKMLITLSAGNIDPIPSGFLARNYRGFRHASFSSPVSLATTLGDVKPLLTDSGMWRSDNVALPDLTFSQERADFVVRELDKIHTVLQGNSLPIGISASNLLIVDSGTDAEALDDVRQSDFDFLGADVRAVGENIKLLDVPAVSIELQEGTSFAAAQVAGLASYLWVVAPDDLRNTLLDAPGMKSLIKANSRTSSNSPTVPVIDAYTATQFLDVMHFVTVGGTDQPIRKALLDVNNDGVFDALDLTAFQQAYLLTDPNRPTIPNARDYSRFDLNGDGFTGGILFEPFDLDANSVGGPFTARIDTVDREIEGYQITFNEAALSDIQILCFYAYSDLYQVGQQNDPRSDILGADHCVGARMNALLPTQITTSANLDVTVELPTGNGQFAPAPNMLVEFTPTCATVNPASGQTDTSGAISTTVTPATGCSSVSVTAVARADVGTTPLGQAVVNATVITSTPPPLLGGYDGTQVNALNGSSDNGFTARWVLVGSVQDNRFVLQRKLDLGGGVSGCAANTCTPEFSLTGGSINVTGTGTGTVTGSVSGGQLHFVYTYPCPENGSGATCMITFDGTKVVIQVAPTTLAFGAVAVGGTSALQSVSIGNTSLLPARVTLTASIPFTLHDIGCLLNSPFSGSFFLAGSASFGVDAGAACAFSVQFGPSTQGPQESTLNVGSEGVIIPVSLSGTGN